MPLPPTEITIDGDRYLHVKEAARIAHVVRDYMSRLCCTGTVHAYRSVRAKLPPRGTET
jgi:hypothetical protein